MKKLSVLLLGAVSCLAVPALNAGDDDLIRALQQDVGAGIDAKTAEDRCSVDDLIDPFDDVVTDAKPHRSQEIEISVDPQPDTSPDQDPLLSLLFGLADEEKKAQQDKPKKDAKTDADGTKQSPMDLLLADLLKNPNGLDGLDANSLLPKEEKKDIEITFKHPTKTIAHYAGRLPQKVKDLINVTRIRNRLVRVPGHENFSNQGRFVILYGPPGTGKTTLSQIIAHETGSAYFDIHAGQLLNKFYGESVKQLNAVFKAAHKEKRAVTIFIDEVDEILGSFEEKDKVRKELRSALNKNIDALLDRSFDDGEDFNPNIVVIVASNHYEDIAANSKTRARNWCVEIPLPKRKSRYAIIKRYLDKYGVPVKDSVIHRMAKDTKGWSGRELEKMVEHSFVISLRKNNIHELSQSSVGEQSQDLQDTITHEEADFRFVIQPTLADLKKAFKDTEREIKIEKQKERDRLPMIDTKRPWINLGQVGTSLTTTTVIALASYLFTKFFPEQKFKLPPVPAPVT